MSDKRYTVVAILLHWLIAAGILALIGSGLWMAEAIKVKETQQAAFEIYQIHKASGLTILVLVVLRFAWRVMHRPPALPATLSRLARTAARVGHGVLYVLMVATPLFGWAMVSASVWGLPTMWFDLFEWPHLPFLADLSHADKERVEATFKLMHQWAAYGFGGLIAGHIGVALKHHFIDRDIKLSRMWPAFGKSDLGED